MNILIKRKQDIFFSCPRTLGHDISSLNTLESTLPFFVLHVFLKNNSNLTYKETLKRRQIITMMQNRISPTNSSSHQNHAELTNYMSLQLDQTQTIMQFNQLRKLNKKKSYRLYNPHQHSSSWVQHLLIKTIVAFID